MNLEVKFNHYLITEMNYKLEVSSFPDSSSDEFLELTTQVNIGVQKDFKNLYLEFVTDINSTVEDKDYRTLSLSVQFFFDIENTEEVQKNERDSNVQMLNDLVEDKLIFMCEQHLQHIIKQITSIDYNEAISVDSTQITFTKEVF